MSLSKPVIVETTPISDTKPDSLTELAIKQAEADGKKTPTIRYLQDIARERTQKEGFLDELRVAEKKVERLEAQLEAKRIIKVCDGICAGGGGLILGLASFVPACCQVAMLLIGGILTLLGIVLKYFD